MIHLLRGASVFAPQPLGTTDVLVAGGRIAAVGDLPVPTGVPIEVHELGGRRLVPGLIDIHTHLTGGGGEGGAHTRVPPVQLTHLTMAGVTTAIGLLGTDGTTRTIAELLAAARGLAHYGVTALCYTGAYEVPPPTLTGSVRGDIVHVDRIVAVGEVAISDHRSSQPTFDEIIRIAADAHVAGMMTGKAGLLHLHMGDGSRGLDMVRRAFAETELPPRVFHPTHCNRNFALWKESMALVEQGGFIDVTAFPPDDAGPDVAEAIRQYVEAGLPIGHLTMSSDGGGCLPVFDKAGQLESMDVGSSASLLEAMARAVELGVDFSTVLATVTSSAADLFRLRSKGRIAVGADADLTVLDDTLGVQATMAGGRWLVREGAPTLRGAFE